MVQNVPSSNYGAKGYAERSEDSGEKNRYIKSENS